MPFTIQNINVLLCKTLSKHTPEQRDNQSTKHEINKNYNKIEHHIRSIIIILHNNNFERLYDCAMLIVVAHKLMDYLTGY